MNSAVPVGAPPAPRARGQRLCLSKAGLVHQGPGPGEGTICRGRRGCQAGKAGGRGSRVGRRAAGSGQGLLPAAEAGAQGCRARPQSYSRMGRLPFLSRVKEAPFSSEPTLATGIYFSQCKSVSLRIAAHRTIETTANRPPPAPRGSARPPLEGGPPAELCAALGPGPGGRRERGHPGGRAQTERTGAPSSFSPSMASWSPLRPLLVTDENCQLSTSESCAQRAQGGFRKKDRFWGEDTHVSGSPRAAASRQGRLP